MSWYSRDCLEPARRMLGQGEKRLRFLLNRVGGRIMTREEVAQVDPEDLSFVNVNFPRGPGAGGAGRGPAWAV